MDDGVGTSPASAPAPRPRPSYPATPAREDCWTEDATRTLIEAWGRRFLDLNRGSLRQRHWQEVADAVNARHGGGGGGASRRNRRSDVQCKNRIDTLKKKYKIEKSRVSASSKGEPPSSPWPFFAALDALIGPSAVAAAASAPAKRSPSPVIRRPPALPAPSTVPVGPRSKRPAPADESFFRRSFSAVAAAAAAMEAAEAAEAAGSGSESWKSSWRHRRRDLKEEKEGYWELARAIERFGKIYERVEEAKQRQMIELEKQRMLFAKDLEFQRMQLYVDTQVQLEKIKRAKRSARADYL